MATTNTPTTNREEILSSFIAEQISCRRVKVYADVAGRRIVKTHRLGFGLSFVVVSGFCQTRRAPPLVEPVVNGSTPPPLQLE